MRHVIRTFALRCRHAGPDRLSAFAQATIHGDLLKDWAGQKDCS